jgi:hypothetical protein
MKRAEEVLATTGKRRWLGRRVWIVDPDGRRHNGTLWWEDESSVLVRQDGAIGLKTFPKSAEGRRWGFADNHRTP